MEHQCEEHFKHACDENKGLKFCLANLLENNPFKIKITHLKNILKNELHVNVHLLNGVLISVMAESLITYMDKWPKLNENLSVEYRSGKITFQQFYDKFREFLRLKVLKIIEQEEYFVKKSEVQSSDVSVQCDENELLQYYSGFIAYSDFALELGGPLHILKNIKFFESNGNFCLSHIPPKQDINSVEPTVSTVQYNFLNCPYLECKLELTHLNIRRFNCHNVNRTLSINEKLEVPNAKYISCVEKHENIETKVYDYNYIEKYFRVLISAYSKVPGMRQDLLKEIENILEEILLDIKNVNINNGSIATGVTVCYNIGGSTYQRLIPHECLSTSSKVKVIFVKEVIVPMVEYEINFTDVQENVDNNISFQYPNQILAAIRNNDTEILDNVRQCVQSAVKYICKFCKQIFYDTNGTDNVKYIDHTCARHFHSSEDAIVSSCCKKEFKVIDLLKQRWSHDKNCQRTSEM